ncbi:endoplasmic reticulum metallopeptidase 1 [Manduca sexta]|uniref:endoplasmic reticulum metallopeptidase 1 n=1 Tax=Manduca sexta TaxID=7130 RepID=UPI00188F1677|nr:endoplasmic reticulum metallopeptidase 1 [Manduca sexta]
MPTKVATEDLVKENVVPRPPLSVWWLVAALAVSGLSVIGVALIDYNLPEPLTRETAPPDRFIAEIAHEHLVNLTSIGPRVAGSYENEVVAVRILVETLKEIARTASPHNRVEYELHTASGGFALTFLDGMNNVYRDVQSVVARVSGAGGRPRGAKQRTALLLNCHYDSVTDSPGASDDGAGCAVLLETMRTLSASRRPLRHDAVFLFNGAEENIMQASHGFITQHKWAKSVRAFINIEACGAGGREVLFQAGPHDPWIMEVYAGVVPHPFASSLAQELFESGFIPADTDFRIFRDFGNLSGVDLAWSTNGYVYHTALDTVSRVPRAALQRTGDNVLALANGLLSSESLESEVELTSRQPVYFDVLGLVVVSARAPLALAMCAFTIAFVLFKVHLNATDAKRQLFVHRVWWWRWVCVCCAAQACSVAVGTAAAAALAMTMHVVGARLRFFATPPLLGPLYAAPALAACWWTAITLWSRWGAVAVRRGWWGARLWHDAAALTTALALLLCAVRGLRSGFLPLLWALLPTISDIRPFGSSSGRGMWRAAWWCVGWCVPALQTWYLALGSLHMLVPLTGRSGAESPSDVIIAVLMALLVLGACSWILPLLIATRNPWKLIYVCMGVGVVTAVLACLVPEHFAYSDTRPQRIMVFHTRRTVHIKGVHTPPEMIYWMPDLDVNTPYTVKDFVAGARAVSAEECAHWLYCGAPYCLPVLSMIGTSHVAPAPVPPLASLNATLHLSTVSDSVRMLQLNITGPNHVVVIVAPTAGAHITWTNLVEKLLVGPTWGPDLRPTYFIGLHHARDPKSWSIDLRIERDPSAPPSDTWADVSVAGHSMFGELRLHEEHARLLRSFPAWVTATGWGVDLHLYTV